MYVGSAGMQALHACVDKMFLLLVALLENLLVGLLLGGCGDTLLAAELETSQAHLLLETFAGVKTGIGGCSTQTACIDIALPVGTKDDATLAIHQAAGQDGVSTLGIDLHQQQGGTPAQRRVA